MPLPLILTIPHCSDRVPPEVRSMLAVDQKEIDRSVDLGTDFIFETHQVLACFKAQWSRVVVDLNRAPDENRRLGVVATMDYHRKPLYTPGREPDDAEVQRRLERYYWPFHNRVLQALAAPGLKIFFDCHSLTAVAPAAAPDAGQSRADVVLGNNGGPDGGPTEGGGPVTCSPEALEIVASAFRDQGLSVSLNQPYRGGYITRHYGQQLVARGSRACQIEINEGLYSTAGCGTIDYVRAKDVREKVRAVFKQVAEEL